MGIRKIPHVLPDVAEVINENSQDATEPEIEFKEENTLTTKQNAPKQTLRDMVEDLIAASLIAVFVILALIAMFYTVSFVRAKEKEKSPTITMKESGSPDRRRKYTVCPARKEDAAVCHPKKFKPSQQHQIRRKHVKNLPPNVSCGSRCRTTETITLPPPRMIATRPRSLCSNISCALSPRPLYPVQYAHDHLSYHPNQKHLLLNHVKNLQSKQLLKQKE